MDVSSGLYPMGVSFTDVTMYNNSVSCIGGAAFISFQTYTFAPGATFTFNRVTIADNTIEQNDTYSCFAQGVFGTSSNITICNTLISNPQSNPKGHPHNCASGQFTDGGNNYQYPNDTLLSGDKLCTTKIAVTTSDPTVGSVFGGSCIVPVLSPLGGVPGDVGHQCVTGQSITDYIKTTYTWYPVGGTIQLLCQIGEACVTTNFSLQTVVSTFLLVTVLIFNIL